MTRSLVIVMASLSVASFGQLHPSQRFTLTASEISQALANQGVPIEDRNVFLLAKVVATESHPVLDVLSIEPLAVGHSPDHIGGDSRIELTCHRPGTCLPFYVMAALRDTTLTRAATAPYPARNGSRKVFDSRPAITIRAGAHVTLMMDDDRSHIQISAVSLENGIIGHAIRVASQDHKRVYVAEVINAGLVRRNF